jgi:hypothetical protein
MILYFVPMALALQIRGGRHLGLHKSIGKRHRQLLGYAQLVMLRSVDAQVRLVIPGARRVSCKKE